MDTQLKHSTVQQWVDARAPKRRKQSARQRADWTAILRANALQPLQPSRKPPYAASNVLMGTDRRYLETLFPSAHTDISRT